MKQLHFILQGKGGVGKSFIASLLKQHFSSNNKPTRGIDTDPVNATFASYKSYEVERLEIMQGDNINPRTFDTLIEWIITADKNTTFIIDNGAASFVPLCAYLYENDVISFLESQECEITFHSVITGGQALHDTMNGLANLLTHFPTVKICIWINEFFGRAEKNGKTFEQTNLYKKHSDQIHGIIQIAEVRKETFGQDLDQMLRNKLSFKEALKSPDFHVMAKQRLKMIWKDIHDQLNALQF